MRRLLALLSIGVLAASLAAPTVAAAAPAQVSGFAGSFVLLDGTDGIAGAPVGHITGYVRVPTDRMPVPGGYLFVGASGNPVRLARAQLELSDFWYDPNHEPNGGTVKGARVAWGRGYVCVYEGPNEASCSGVEVTFVDCVDPAVRNEVVISIDDGTGAYSNPTWYFVGAGAFKVTVAGY
jgi:hypothetical protein